jgi:hypothetical protein
LTTTRSKNYPLNDGFFQSVLKAAFGEVIPEHKFHPKRKWRIDFFIPQLRVGIEIEGGIWRGGRHNHPAGFMKDIEKYNTAALMGIILYRVPAPDTKSAVKIFEHVNRLRYYLIEKRDINGEED